MGRKYWWPGRSEAEVPSWDTLRTKDATSAFEAMENMGVNRTDGLHEEGRRVQEEQSNV